MKYVLKQLVLLVSSALLLVSIQASAQNEDIKIKVTSVAGNIYMLEGRGGNIGASAGEDGLLIVDDQFAPLAEKIEKALSKINKGKLKFVLNTHWHGDHTGGNAYFGKKATIIAHDNVLKRLSEKTKPKPLEKEALPVITFAKDINVHFNGEKVRVIHLPTGHTDGDSVVWFTKSNVIHLGDHFFNKRFPFVDTNSGGSVPGYISNLETVLTIITEDTKIIPGHGQLANIDDLKNNIVMLKNTLKIVSDYKSNGKSLDEIKKEGLGAQWKSYSWGFITEERWIETLYNSLL